MIRAADLSDVPAMVEIYNQAIDDEVHANCDTPQSDAAKFAQSYFFGSARYIAMVVESDTRAIVGWAALKKFSALPGDESTAEVAVYIRRDDRSLGSGIRLLRALIAHARASAFFSLVAIILGENVQSIRGCRHCGFEQSVTMPLIARLYGQDEDVVWMQKVLM